MKQIFSFAIFFLLILPKHLLSQSSNWDNNIDNKIETISIDDQGKLEFFFRYLITQEGFGYVIFGDKPAAFAAIYSKKMYFRPQYSEIIIYNHLWSNYLIWEKYKRNFLMNNYIFRFIKSPYNKFQYDFWLINKRNCIKVLKKNLKLFEKRLKRRIDPITFLGELEIKNDILNDVLQGHEDLLGILLGFGRHNSQLYQKREDLDRLKGYPPFNFEKVLDIYDAQLSGFPADDNEENLLSYIQLPCFMEDKNHPESIQIRQKYLDTQKALGRIYSQGKFLTVTIKELVNNN